jgi:hypothetical protein
MAMPEVKPDPVTVAKMAQLGQLIKDNQLVTAVIVFVLWQAGTISQGLAIVGGVC